MTRSFTKQSWIQMVALVAAIGITVAVGGNANGQGYGEHIISSNVVSDEVTVPAESYSSGSVIDGGTIEGEVVDGGVVGGGVAQRRDYGQPDLFYNYYTQGNANSTNAQMYVSPVPVPHNVGHTFGTYQPWYPHHYLYWHKDRYHNYYDNGRGMNRTRATYYSPPVRQAVSNMYWNKLRLPR